MYCSTCTMSCVWELAKTTHSIECIVAPARCLVSGNWPKQHIQSLDCATRLPTVRIGLTATLSPRRDAACRLRCPTPPFSLVEKGQEMLDEQLQRAVAQGLLVGLEGPFAGVIALELDAGLEDQQGGGGEGNGRCRVEIALARGGRLAGHDADRLGEGGVLGEQIERRAGQVAFGGCGGRGIVEGGGQGDADVRRGGDVGRGGAQPCLGDGCQDLDGGGVVEGGHSLGSVGGGPRLASRQLALSLCLSAGGALIGRAHG